MNDRLVQHAPLQHKLVQIIYALAPRDVPVPVLEASCRKALGAPADVFAHIVGRPQARDVLNLSCPAGWLKLTYRGVQLARKLR